MNVNDRDDYTELAERVTRMLEGRRIVSFERNGEIMNLENGTSVELYESEADCCASARGVWCVDEGNLDAIITKVEIDLVADRLDTGGYGESESVALITVLSNQNAVVFGECEANDGNGGYYMSVLSLRVRVGDDVALDEAFLAC